MAQTALEGNPVNLTGDLPAVGSTAPDFKLTASDLSDVTLANYAGKKKLLNIVPSLDTGVCAASTKKFNEAMAGRDDAVALVISADLPFASGRFCAAEGITNVVTARAVVVLDADNKVLYTQLVPEITQEPDYDSAMAALG